MVLIVCSIQPTLSPLDGNKAAQKMIISKNKYREKLKFVCGVIIINEGKVLGKIYSSG